MPDRILRLPEVQARSGLSRSTVYLRIAQGKFPRAVPLGSPQVVGWLESEIESWIAEQVRAARGEPFAQTA
jgi:prophage regulatory protein